MKNSIGWTLSLNHLELRLRQIIEPAQADDPANTQQGVLDLAHGRAASFAVIARREGKVERRIRLLAPLAFLSPRIVSALLDGTAPANLTLTLTQLARALPYSWTEQERRVGTSFLT